MLPLWFTEIVKKLFAAQPVEKPSFPPLRVNEDGWLEGDGVEIMKIHPTWHYPKLSTVDGIAKALVWHTSATSHGTAVNMAKNRMKAYRPRKPEHKDEDAGKLFDRAASWHLSIESNKIVQMVSLEAGAWHAAGLINGLGSANRISIGIEMVGFEKGPWPEAQIDNAARVCKAIVESYGIPRKWAMVEHRTIDPKRRSDPGKEFMSKHSKRILDYAFNA